MARSAQAPENLLPTISPTPSRRSFTGHHDLLNDQDIKFVHPVPAADQSAVSTWTFGRGTVIWRIWPAVLLHTLFATLVVGVSHETRFNLAINNSLLIVMGVVIGFVISYRTSVGADRYSQGRTMWGDVIKNCRGLSRLVWLHIPLKLASDKEATLEEMKQVLAEKQVALTLIEAFAVALKHHLRGETSIYYADLYPLLLPLQRGDDQTDLMVGSQPVVSSPPPMQLAFPAASITDNLTRSKYPFAPDTAPNTSIFASNQVDYGTFYHSCSAAGRTGTDAEGRPLLPSSVHRRETITGAVSVSLIPFHAFFVFVWNIFTLRSFKRLNEVEKEERNRPTPYSHRRHRPRVAGRGGNLPLVVIRAISEWVATLDHRGTVSGLTLGPIMGNLQALENALTDLERLLTTPLPVIYSAHLRTVWLYLFFLPFQLSDPMGYLAVLAVGIAAFLYLGFLAAGEEIEEPFGYEENDLDLDLFIRE
ncbi:hypothetical protein FRB95_003601, partial [Tulasnella sp. JGI-2019a]